MDPTYSSYATLDARKYFIPFLREEPTQK